MIIKDICSKKQVEINQSLKVFTLMEKYFFESLFFFAPTKKQLYTSDNCLSINSVIWVQLVLVNSNKLSSNSLFFININKL